MQNTLGRELHGHGHMLAALGQSKLPALDKAMFAGNGEWQGFAQLFVWMTAFGYLSMQSKLMAKGQTPRPLDHKSVMAAMAQGGGLMGISFSANITVSVRHGIQLGWAIRRRCRSVKKPVPAGPRWRCKGRRFSQVRYQPYTVSQSAWCTSGNGLSYSEPHAGMVITWFS